MSDEALEEIKYYSENPPIKRDKTAREMFEELGYEEKQCFYNGILDEISYEANNYATCIRFRLFNKTYLTYYKDEEGNENVANVGIELHNAIQKQIEELGW